MERRTVWVPAAALILYLAGCSEANGNYYPTYADAVRANAVRRGWIPEFVPTSAYEIHEVHDVDTNMQRMRFRVPSSDVYALTRTMIPQSLSQIHELQRSHTPPSLGVPWPRELESGGGNTTLRLFVISASENPTLCVAVDWQTGLMHAWTCSKPGN